MDNGASSYRRFREEGDEEGLCEIIRDYKDGLIFYLYGIVGDMRLAEELCEDTFVHIGVKKPRDRGSGSFKTWLYTIGRNIAIDHIRRVKRRREVSIDDCAELRSDEEEFEESYIREERKIQVHRALRRLKSDYRQVLWLRFFEEMSYRDIAAVMHRSTHSSEVLCSRAKAALRSQLESEGFIYEEL